MLRSAGPLVHMLLTWVCVGCHRSIRVLAPNYTPGRWACLPGANSWTAHVELCWAKGPSAGGGRILQDTGRWALPRPSWPQSRAGSRGDAVRPAGRSYKSSPWWKGCWARLGRELVLDTGAKTLIKHMKGIIIFHCKCISSGDRLDFVSVLGSVCPQRPSLFSASLPHLWSTYKSCCFSLVGFCAV